VRTYPQNAQNTKVIGRYDVATPGLIVARHDLDEALRKLLLDALVRWVPKWEAVYGAFRPFYYADVHHFFHDLDQLPPLNVTEAASRTGIRCKKTERLPTPSPEAPAG
jgi:hypothetical protein